ncbi:hypothetical protein E2C01_025152 [Portunus trituberculatus]|uniref:Uncharacterized protein n=1 Tax=Portunus trituberculatus TaxID=210409 RepID=A0A5B7ECL0_PORTR|nr:hypothetical protein [Portunus trituberculatus]
MSYVVDTVVACTIEAQAYTPRLPWPRPPSRRGVTIGDKALAAQPWRLAVRLSSCPGAWRVRAAG